MDGSQPLDTCPGWLQDGLGVPGQLFLEEDVFSVCLWDVCSSVGKSAVVWLGEDQWAFRCGGLVPL